LIRTLSMACVALLAFVVAASAQSFTPDPIDMAAAKKEGTVT